MTTNAKNKSGKKDALFVIHFAKDNLDAYADFIPAEQGGLPFTLSYIKDVLSHDKVTFNVNEDIIIKTMNDVNNYKKEARNVHIAHGLIPVSYCSAYYKKRDIKKAENENQDYKNFSPFIIIKKDEILADYIAEKIGVEGFSVCGEKIQFETENPNGVIAGNNTRADEKHIYANVAGELVYTKNTISVNTKLIIEGGVNYNTGNILFPGDVEIKGSVADGFKIYIDGNLTVHETLYATDIITKGAITVEGGIIGRIGGSIKAGGEIRAKFVENCKIAARKNIYVDAEIMNSTIYTMDSVIMGERGFIVGSDIYAAHCLQCARIGRVHAKPSKIHAGIDFMVQREIDKKANVLRFYYAKIEKLNTLIASANPNDKKRNEELAALDGKLKNAIEITTEEITKLEKKAAVDENASVVIGIEAAEGTLIEICQIALFIDRPIKKSVLKLDKAQGKITGYGV